MASNPQRDDTPEATRLFGVETEYGFAVLGAYGRQLDPTKNVLALMGEAKRLGRAATRAIG